MAKKMANGGSTGKSDKELRDFLDRYDRRPGPGNMRPRPIPNVVIPNEEFYPRYPEGRIGEEFKDWVDRPRMARGGKVKYHGG